MDGWMDGRTKEVKYDKEEIHTQLVGGRLLGTIYQCGLWARYLKLMDELF